MAILDYSNSQRYLPISLFKFKNIIYRHTEHLRQAQSKHRRWIEFSLFDGNNRLPAHIHFFGKPLLRLTQLGAFYSQTILQKTNPCFLSKQ